MVRSQEVLVTQPDRDEAYKALVAERFGEPPSPAPKEDRPMYRVWRQWPDGTWGVVGGSNSEVGAYDFRDHIISQQHLDEDVVQFRVLHRDFVIHPLYLGDTQVSS